jgi:hypothetical protein
MTHANEFGMAELRVDLAPRLAALRSPGSPLRQALGNGVVERYVQAARGRSPYVYAALLPSPMERQHEQLRRRAAPELLRELNALTLFTLIEERLDDPGRAGLPSGVADLQIAWFRRILELPGRAGDDLDLLRADGSRNWELRFDFAVAAGRMVPVGGAWTVEWRRLPKSELFGGQNASAPPDRRGASARRLPQRVLARGARLLGLEPWLERVGHALQERRQAHGNYLVVHTAHQYRRWFSERHQATAFRNVAALLSGDASLEGLYRKSWFLDPQVSVMDPRMGFLLQPLEFGAQYARVGPISVEDQQQILAFSAARRAQYAEESYDPEVWAYLWRREDLLAWAARADGQVADAPVLKPRAR